MKSVARFLVLLVLLAGAGGAAFLALRRSDAQPGAVCAATVTPGQDIARALDDAAAGATVCLTSGVHRPFAGARLRSGVTLRGEGADRTTIQADRRDGLDITDSERFTLADLTVRGGSPAGMYVARVRDLTLRNVRVESAAIALHLEAASANLTDVTLTGSTDFGLLVRRGASITGRGLHVLEHRGIGIGAVESPGPVTLTDSDTARAAEGRGEGIVLNGFERFSLSNVSVRGGNPAGIYVANARDLQLRGVRIAAAVFGLHLDQNTNATIDDLSITGSTGVGFLIQRGGTATAGAVRVLDTAGTGISLINGAGALTLRDSEIARIAAAGLFAGVAGCADLPPASLEVPPCFYQDLQSQISTIRVTLERVSMADTRAPCLVFFAGVRAEVRDSTLVRCELTGLFAWGATADVRGTTFEDNAEHALEYRAFPDPRGAVLREAAGTIEDSTIRNTRPLEGAILGDAGPGPVLGGGILAQGARLTVRRTEVSANRDIGVSYVNRSTGEIAGNRIVNNGGAGLCIVAGVSVTLRDNTVTGNRTNDLNACGGLADGR